MLIIRESVRLQGYRVCEVFNSSYDDMLHGLSDVTRYLQHGQAGWYDRPAEFSSKTVYRFGNIVQWLLLMIIRGHKFFSEIDFLIVPDRGDRYIYTRCFWSHEKMLFVAEVITAWRSALQCNCIARVIFNHVPCKIDLKNLSPPTVFEESSWNIQDISLGTYSKSWKKQNFDLGF